VLAQVVLGVAAPVSTMYYRAAASVAIPFGPEAANSQAVEPTLVGLVIVLETIAAAYERIESDSSWIAVLSVAAVVDKGKYKMFAAVVALVAAAFQYAFETK